MWMALYETDTGRLLSLTTVAPSPVPVGTTLLDIGETLPQGYHWDAIVRNFVPDPPRTIVDLVKDLLECPEVAAFNLNLARLTSLENAARRIFNGRYD